MAKSSFISSRNRGLGIRANGVMLCAVCLCLCVLGCSKTEHTNCGCHEDDSWTPIAYHDVNEENENGVKALHFDGRRDSLPAKITSYSKLCYLGVFGSKMEVFPKEVRQLENLDVLIFEGANLSHLPEDLRLPCLRRLDLDHNKMRSFSISSKYFPSLRSLSVSDNGMDSIVFIGDALDHIEFVDLSGNDLGHIPPACMRMGSMTYLDLANNGIDKIPNNISDLRAIEMLNLSDNRISDFLPLAELATLVELRLDNQEIHGFGLKIPPLDFPSLKFLSLAGVNGAALSGVEKANLGNLEYLNLSGCNLEEIPPFVFQLSSLQILHLSDNLISGISEEIGNLKNLRELHVSNNQIDTLPQAIWDLPNLKTVYAFGNRIQNGEGESDVVEIVLIDTSP